MVRPNRNWLQSRSQVLGPAETVTFPGDLARPTLFEYWRIFYRRRWTVLAVITTCLALAAVYSITATRLYRATGRISIEKQDPNALGFKGDRGLSVDDVEYNMQLDAQEKILTSDTLILQTLRNLKIVPPPPASVSGLPQPMSQQERGLLRTFESNLQVARVGHTPLVEIRFASPNPQYSARFVNGLVQAYIEQNFNVRYRSSQQVSAFLARELADLKVKVEESQANLAAFQKKVGILGTDNKQNIVMEKLDDINRELTLAQGDRMQKEAVYRAALSGDPELLPGVSDSQVIKNLKDEQAKVANNYAQATSQMGPAHPQVQQLKSELDQVDAALKAEYQTIAERNGKSYFIAKHREDMLRDALNQQIQAANNMNESSIQYGILKHEADSNQALYDGLSQRLKEADVSAGLESGNVRVVDPAQVPTSPSSPNIPLNFALALFMGCVGGSSLAFVRERLDSRLRTPTEVESFSSLPMIGTVPRIPIAAASQRSLLSKGKSVTEADTLIIQDQPRAELLESYRALRSSLLMSSSGVPPQVIMVTSALPSEGKTTTSINCAVVLAQAGARVLLVDADLRAPRIHKVLGLSSRCGLSTLLNESSGDNDRDAIVQFAQVPNLFVLPSGPRSEEPARLLDAKIMKKKIETWRKLFTHIIIDTPPVLACSDSVVLSTEVDSVLLATLAGYTLKDALLRARDLLLNVNANIVGVVVNGLELGSSEYFWYSYYAENYGRRGDHRSQRSRAN
ncbi:MAG: polysaccharide biosynthesis tyrosine autokinase [Candidatus Sulfotelmatobacter sp.]